MVFKKDAVQDVEVVAEVKAEGGATQPRLAKAPKTGICEYCGAETKGGKFCPGHDSKLKSQLTKEFKAGSEEAKAILLERKWADEAYFANYYAKLDKAVADKKAKEEARAEKAKADAEAKVAKKAEAKPAE
jgi:hypothetical protein